MGGTNLHSMLRRLVGSMIEIEELDEDLWCVDGTVIRAARCAAGATKKGGRPKMLANRPWAAPARVSAPKSMSCATAGAIR